MDDWFEIADPEGVAGLVAVEARASVLPRDLPALLARIRSAAAREKSPVTPMIVGRYLAPSVRDALIERGVSYADATGNLRVVLSRPAIFLVDSGGQRDPWRRPGRPRGTLQGPAAARVVRALVDFRPPVTVPELVRRSGASTGATYRVVEFLTAEALIERAPRGPITSVAWRPLIERWSEDYGFVRNNAISHYLQPRGLSAVFSGLATVREGLTYAVTGSLAASPFAPYAPPHLAMIYTNDAAALVKGLGLRRVDTGGNMLLAESDYTVVFERATEVDGVRCVAPGQAAVDLLTGPGRSPAEATALLDWMEDNEHDWRS